MEKIKKNTELIGISELENIENIYSIKFPEDYKKYMLQYNGGDPICRLFFKPDVWDDEVKLSYFLPISYGDYTFEEANNEEDFLDYPEEHLLIGNTLTGTLSISFKKLEYGSVYVNYSDGEMHKLADSFTEFLEGLEEL